MRLAPRETCPIARRLIGAPPSNRAGRNYGAGLALGTRTRRRVRGQAEAARRGPRAIARTTTGRRPAGSRRGLMRGARGLERNADNAGRKSGPKTEGAGLALLPPRPAGAGRGV